VNLGQEQVYYVPQIEDFTAFIEHTMTASSLGLSYSWQNELLEVRERGIMDSDGNWLDPCDDYGAAAVATVLAAVLTEICICDVCSGQDMETQRPRPDPSAGCPSVVRIETGARNIVPLRTLLRAAGVTNLDTEGDFDCDPSDESPGCESYRYAGLVLQVDIHYDNTFSFDTRRVRFWYTVQRVEQVTDDRQEAPVAAFFITAQIYLDARRLHACGEPTPVFCRWPHSETAVHSQLGGERNHSHATRGRAGVGVASSSWRGCGTNPTLRAVRCRPSSRATRRCSRTRRPGRIALSTTATASASSFGRCAHRVGDWVAVPRGLHPLRPNKRLSAGGRRGRVRSADTAGQHGGGNRLA
jgi:hypothetical protein